MRKLRLKLREARPVLVGSSSLVSFLQRFQTKFIHRHPIDDHDRHIGHSFPVHEPWDFLSFHLVLLLVTAMPGLDKGLSFRCGAIS